MEFGKPNLQSSGANVPKFINILDINVVAFVSKLGTKKTSSKMLKSILMLKIIFCHGEIFEFP
jgi:hypothetical protein